MWEREDIKARCGTEEYKAQMRRARAKVKSYKISSMETKLSKLLDLLNIQYTPQARIASGSGVYSIDFLLDDLKIALECDGIYWHHYPHYRGCDLLKNIKLEARGLTVIRLWEHEIVSMEENVLETIIKSRSRSAAETLPVPAEYIRKLSRCTEMFSPGDNYEQVR
jgi:very-short-patch-repair endonuclease